MIDTRFVRYSSFFATWMLLVSCQLDSTQHIDVPETITLTPRLVASGSDTLPKSKWVRLDIRPKNWQAPYNFQTWARVDYASKEIRISGIPAGLNFTVEVSGWNQDESMKLWGAVKEVSPGIVPVAVVSPTLVVETLPLAPAIVAQNEAANSFGFRHIVTCSGASGEIFYHVTKNGIATVDKRISCGGEIRAFAGETIEAWQLTPSGISTSVTHYLVYDPTNTGGSGTNLPALEMNQITNATGVLVQLRPQGGGTLPTDAEIRYTRFDNGGATLAKGLVANNVGTYWEVFVQSSGTFQAWAQSKTDTAKKGPYINQAIVVTTNTGTNTLDAPMIQFSTSGTGTMANLSLSQKTGLFSPEMRCKVVPVGTDSSQASWQVYSGWFTTVPVNIESNVYAYGTATTSSGGKINSPVAQGVGGPKAAADIPKPVIEVIASMPLVGGVNVRLPMGSIDPGYTVAYDQLDPTTLNAYQINQPALKVGDHWEIRVDRPARIRAWFALNGKIGAASEEYAQPQTQQVTNLETPALSIVKKDSVTWTIAVMAKLPKGWSLPRIRYNYWKTFGGQVGERDVTKDTIAFEVHSNGRIEAYFSATDAQGLMQSAPRIDFPLDTLSPKAPTAPILVYRDSGIQIVRANPEADWEGFDYKMWPMGGTSNEPPYWLTLNDSNSYIPSGGTDMTVMARSLAHGQKSEVTTLVYRRSPNFDILDGSENAVALERGLEAFPFTVRPFSADQEMVYWYSLDNQEPDSTKPSRTFRAVRGQSIELNPPVGRDTTYLQIWGIKPGFDRTRTKVYRIWKFPPVPTPRFLSSTYLPLDSVVNLPTGIRPKFRFAETPGIEQIKISWDGSDPRTASYLYSKLIYQSSLTQIDAVDFLESKDTVVVRAVAVSQGRFSAEATLVLKHKFWQPMGEIGEEVTALWVGPQGSSVVKATTAGIYRRNAPSESWMLLHPTNLTGRVNRITDGGDKLWLSCDSGVFQLFQANDAMAPKEPASSPRRVTDILLQADTVFAAADSGLWAISQTGNAWELKRNGWTVGLRANRLAAYPNGQIAVASPQGLFVSDPTITFNPLPGGWRALGGMELGSVWWDGVSNKMRFGSSNYNNGWRLNEVDPGSNSFVSTNVNVNDTSSVYYQAIPEILRTSNNIVIAMDAPQGGRVGKIEAPDISGYQPLRPYGYRWPIEPGSKQSARINALVFEPGLPGDTGWLWAATTEGVLRLKPD